MEYKEFKTELQEKVQKEMGSHVKIKFVTVLKNNQTDWEELACEAPGENATPAIPLKEFYKRYQEKGIDWCVGAAVTIFETGDMINEGELFQTWEKMKRKIRIELVNHAWNQEMLKTVPHKKFLDLAILFRIIICETEQTTAGCIVTGEMMNYWEIDIEELYGEALQNLYREEQFEIVGLEKEAARIMGKAYEKDKEDDDIFLLSNRRRTKGASGMLRTDLLTEFAEKQGCDLIILPSSLHEILLLPNRADYNIVELREMVRSVNMEAVAEEERLSNEIYIFKRVDGKIECIKE